MSQVRRILPVPRESDHDLIFGMRKISRKTNNVSENIRYYNLKHYHGDCMMFTNCQAHGRNSSSKC